MIGRNWPRSVDTIIEYVHLEGLAMFEHVFRLEAAAKLAKEGRLVPVHGGACDPTDDQFALTERGMSVVHWTRGRAGEAIFPGVKAEGQEAARFPACEEYLGVKVQPGERVPAHLARMLTRLEERRGSGAWGGGAFRCFKREVFRRKVQVVTEGAGYGIA